jgi:hypothetical protein
VILGISNIGADKALAGSRDGEPFGSVGPQTYRILKFILNSFNWVQYFRKNTGF